MTMVRSMQQVRPRLHFADLERMPEDGRRFELYDGESTDRGRKLRLLARSGVREYWLIDARSGQVRFDIHTRGPMGYRAARKLAGWVKSKVFARSFRLTRSNGVLGFPDYTLEVR